MNILTIALNNKYTKWYINICDNARSRSNSKLIAKSILGFVEGHHVSPKSIFGNNNDIVFLTIREHFICHKLLIRMLTGDYKRKMEYALTCFSYDTDNRKLNDLQIKAALSFKHKPCCETRKKNIQSSRLKTQKITCSHCNKSFDPGNYKQFHGENCKLNPNIDNSFLRSRSNKRKQSYLKQIERGNYNKPKPPIGLFTCKFCNFSNTNYGYMHRYHFDKCKFKPS